MSIGFFLSADVPFWIRGWCQLSMTTLWGCLSHNVGLYSTGDEVTSDIFGVLPQVCLYAMRCLIYFMDWVVFGGKVSNHQFKQQVTLNTACLLQNQTVRHWTQIFSGWLVDLYNLELIFSTWDTNSWSINNQKPVSMLWPSNMFS